LYMSLVVFPTDFAALASVRQTVVIASPSMEPTKVQSF
jgi:hypothetical protein